MMPAPQHQQRKGPQCQIKLTFLTLWTLSRIRQCKATTSVARIGYVEALDCAFEATIKPCGWSAQAFSAAFQAYFVASSEKAIH